MPEARIPASPREHPTTEIALDREKDWREL
jgi:hypothetical protein